MLKPSLNLKLECLQKQSPKIFYFCTLSASRTVDKKVEKHGHQQGCIKKTMQKTERFQVLDAVEES